MAKRKKIDLNLGKLLDQSENLQFKGDFFDNSNFNDLNYWDNYIDSELKVYGDILEIYYNDDKLVYDNFYSQTNHLSGFKKITAQNWVDFNEIWYSSIDPIWREIENSIKAYVKYASHKITKKEIDEFINNDIRDFTEKTDNGLYGELLEWIKIYEPPAGKMWWDQFKYLYNQIGRDAGGFVGS